MKRTTIILTIMAAGCAAPAPEWSARTEDRPARVEPVPAAPMVTVDYTYELLKPEETGLVQVFDDGNATYLRFGSSVPMGLMLFDEGGNSIAFSASGSAAMVSTVRTGILLRTPTSRSYAQSRSPGRTARLETYEGVATGKATLPAELAAARAEILSAQRRLSSLSAELELASRGEPVRPLAELRTAIHGIETQIDGLAATLMRTHFTSGSAVPELSQAALDSLIEAARAAGRVRLEGGTDATGDPVSNTRLALARASEVRRLLQVGGVARAKLSIRVAPEYVASNATRDGRAENRRVDVILLSTGIAQTPVGHDGLADGSGR